MSAEEMIRQELFSWDAETHNQYLARYRPDLGFLKRYASNRYSTDRAVRDIIKNHDKLSLSRDALVILNEARDFYHGYSHPTLRTISTLIEFKGGRTFIGASFDPGKQFAYDKEVSTRVQVAGLLENMIQGIRHNLLS